MLNNRIVELLNEQINKEFYSAYLYLEIHHYFEERGLEGFAHWYKCQAHEECEHGMKIMKYLQSEDAEVDLMTIEQPRCSCKCDLDVVLKALEHEEYITESINTIYGEAAQIYDYRTCKFLDWFVDEQAEEEYQARTIVSKLRLYGDDCEGLYMLNKDLGKR